MTFIQFFAEYMLPALGTLFGGLISWGAASLIKWLGAKIKNTEILSLTTTILTIAQNAVKATYQSYVQAIKGTEEWTEEAQKNALDMALKTAKSELTVEALAYIKKEHGDIDKYLKTLFESILYDLKNLPTAK